VWIDNFSLLFCLLLANLKTSDRIPPTAVLPVPNVVEIVPAVGLITTARVVRSTTVRNAAVVGSSVLLGRLLTLACSGDVTRILVEA